MNVRPRPLPVMAKCCVIPLLTEDGGTFWLAEVEGAGVDCTLDGVIGCPGNGARQARCFQLGSDRACLTEIDELNGYGNRHEARGIEVCAQFRVDHYGGVDAPIAIGTLNERDIDTVKIDSVAREPGAIDAASAPIAGPGIALPIDPGADQRESGGAAELEAENANRFRVEPRPQGRIVLHGGKRRRRSAGRSHNSSGASPTRAPSSRGGRGTATTKPSVARRDAIQAPESGAERRPPCERRTTGNEPSAMVASCRAGAP
jgi:hypothetical protein